MGSHNQTVSKEEKKKGVGDENVTDQLCASSFH